MPEAALALSRCSACGATFAPNELSCPFCQTLVHATRLKELAARAQASGSGGDEAGALGAWREALDLLPFGTKQYEQVRDRVHDLSSRVSTTSSPGPPRAKATGRGPLAGIGAAILVLGSKAKLLLLGLAKLPTLLSAMAFFGVYWSVWGWKYALGLVAAIYVHEMGHVWELRRFGLPATAPMFIPGFGALVRLKARPASVYEDARIGLAGPWWGLGAAVAAAILGAVTGFPSVVAIAFSAGWMNTFNLLPLSSLDGSRGIKSLSKIERGLVAAVCLGTGYAVGAEIFYLVGGVGLVRAFMSDANPAGDRRGFVSFVALVIALGAVMAASGGARLS